MGLLATGSVVHAIGRTIDLDLGDEELAAEQVLDHQCSGAALSARTVTAPTGCDALAGGMAGRCAPRSCHGGYDTFDGGCVHGPGKVGLRIPDLR